METFDWPLRAGQQGSAGPGSKRKARVVVLPSRCEDPLFTHGLQRTHSTVDHGGNYRKENGTGVHLLSVRACSCSYTALAIDAKQNLLSLQITIVMMFSLIPYLV